MCNSVAGSHDRMIGRCLAGSVPPPANNAPGMKRAPGRPRIHATAAASKRAYRARQRTLVAEARAAREQQVAAVDDRLPDVGLAAAPAAAVLPSAVEAVAEPVKFLFHTELTNFAMPTVTSAGEAMI